MCNATGAIAVTRAKRDERWRAPGYRRRRCGRCHRYTIGYARLPRAPVKVSAAKLAKCELAHTRPRSRRGRAPRKRKREMAIRNGEQLLQSLRDDRLLFIDGERVGNVTTDPRFAGAAHSLARLYD